MPTTSLAAAAPWADFHPAVASWFRAAFPAGPTQAQLRAWPLIRARRPTLVAAPTGSGKTLTAFLAVIDELVRASVAGALPDATTVLYVSPLKALSNDIRINLQAPLEGIARELARLGLPDHGIRAAVRTGDTSNPERLAMRRRAPHILVTTPESLYVLLGSDSGRAMLADVRSVIVDEIHAVAGGKRGSHLALSLERLDALCAERPTRIGLSATQKPLAAVARFLVGRGGVEQCALVDVGHVRARDLKIELPPAPLEAVMANEVWERVYDRMAELAAQHRTTLVFVNSRRMAERAARHLSERLGDALVTAHHGSLAMQYRLDAERRLKRGELRVLVATASLELGIDIGDVGLVCQVGSPRSIAALLQRVGRSGHQVGGMPKGRLFPTSRDDLIECAALLDCVRRDELDALRIPRAPLDVLAQQIVAEVASREWGEEDLFDLVRRAEPYAGLARGDYDAVLRMLAEGYAGRNGVRASYIHRDSVAGTLRGRRGGKLTAVTSGGTIPDNADYAVLLEPQGQPIGSVNEDFAVECIAGDIFQLGNISYRILRVDAGRVRVVDARGAAPTMPFWLGEAPGRSDELSAGVARLRARIERWLAGEGDAADAAAAAAGAMTPPPRTTTAATPDYAGASGQRAEGGNFTTAEGMAPADAAAPALGGVIDALAASIQIDFDAARQIVEYLARARSALGALPTQDCLVMERFFDESGGMQLVLHSPFGSRVNRAWGLALRKRFCRTFNFELQAAATEDAIVLSLSTSHSFALDEVWRYLRSGTAEHVLIQALLDAPLFNVRWRWNATTSLALPRYSGGRKVAPQLQRMKSEDLLAAVFPDQVACFENLVGERELPNHPLVAQTIDDCLHEAMDSEGWLALLRRIEQGRVRLVARDLPAPSPLAMEILNARPYAFLDDAPLEERRTQAVLSRRWSDPESSDDLGALDAGAIDGVREEAWPQARNADEMHEALMSLSCVTPAEAGAQEGWPEWLDALARSGRATRLRIGAGEDQLLWVAVERLACLQAAYPRAECEPALTPPSNCRSDWERDEAIVEIVRARLGGFGPLALEDIARPLGLPPGTVAIALGKLEGEGYVMRGRFTPGGAGEEWCERHLLARIHRYTIKRLRREIEPVERRDYMRFLFDWQHLAPETRLRGRDALPAVLAQLEGYEAAAGAWESELLPARLGDYSAAWLDELCRAGRLAWTRIGAPPHSSGGPVRATPIVLLPRRQLGVWRTLPRVDEAPETSARSRRVLALMRRHGAMFFDEMLGDAHLLPEELENALGELVATGLVTADSFAGLRALLVPTAKRARAGRRRHGGGAMPTMGEAGRWALVSRAEAGGGESDADGGTDGEPDGDRERKRDGDADRDRDGGATVAARSVLRSPATPGKRQRLDPQTLEHVAQVLLRRYGVVCWRLLEREAGWLPPWRDLLPVFHRLEARGELRGGRFVAGLTGEQFAVPEAIPLLREVRRRPPGGDLVCVSASDPLNLCGGVLPGDKIPALAGNRVLFRDGVPVAALVADKVRYLVEPDARDRDALRAALIRSH